MSRPFRAKERFTTRINASIVVVVIELLVAPRILSQAKWHRFSDYDYDYDNDNDCV